MNILFLTLGDMRTIYSHGIYSDLLRELVNNGNELFVVSPIERKKNIDTHIITEDHCRILKLRIGNVQKTNVIEKGISTLIVEPQFINAIRKYFSDCRFDLVLYSTPPITFAGAIQYVKKRDNAKTYLLLKDIFPQNAVDIGMLTKEGMKGVLYNHFRRQEKKLYAISDHIGCMSKANVDYLLKHNLEIRPDRVSICPNCIDPQEKTINNETRIAIRKKYGIPFDKKVFVYGGNLGKPQDIPFIIKCLEQCRDISDAFFLIVGDGVDYHLLDKYARTDKQYNFMLMKRLPKDDYDTMIAACDIGLIVLDHRFTIPNFPSRLLGYMQAKIPVLALTDINSDVGKVIVDGGFGWWRESREPSQFREMITEICSVSIEDCKIMGETGYKYLCDNYHVKQAANGILTSISQEFN